MREDCKYYSPYGCIKGKGMILCNGKIVRGNHAEEAEEAWSNYVQSSSKNAYEQVTIEFLSLIDQ